MHSYATLNSPHHHLPDGEQARASVQAWPGRPPALGLLRAGFRKVVREQLTNPDLTACAASWTRGVHLKRYTCACVSLAVQLVAGEFHGRCGLCLEQ